MGVEVKKKLFSLERWRLKKYGQNKEHGKDKWGFISLAFPHKNFMLIY